MFDVLLWSTCNCGIWAMSSAIFIAWHGMPLHCMPPLYKDENFWSPTMAQTQPVFVSGLGAVDLRS